MAIEINEFGGIMPEHFVSALLFYTVDYFTKSIKRNPPGYAVRPGG